MILFKQTKEMCGISHCFPCVMIQLQVYFIMPAKISEKTVTFIVLNILRVLKM
jgi:hypothetical protein